MARFMSGVKPLPSKQEVLELSRFGSKLPDKVSEIKDGHMKIVMVSIKLSGIKEPVKLVKEEFERLGVKHTAKWHY